VDLRVHTTSARIAQGHRTPGACTRQGRGDTSGAAGKELWMGKVIVFGNHKGGVGKSTLAVLYAYWLADLKQQSVCVIDLDAQANSSKSLARFATDIESAQLFRAQARVPQALGAADDAQRIVLVPGSRHLAEVELAPPDKVIPAFRSCLLEAVQRFDSVVVDTPPALGLRMSAALIGADAVACPIELEAYSIDGMADMLKTIFGVRKRYNPRLRLAGILLNRFNAHSQRQKAALQHLAVTFSEFVIPARISTRSAIPEALASGVPVWGLPRTAAREASLEVMAAFELLHQRVVGPDAIPRAAEPIA
jgi:chromosome partitioning protein